MRRRGNEIKTIEREQKAAKENDFETYEEEIAELVEKAVSFADESPEPGLEEIYEHVLI